MDLRLLFYNAFLLRAGRVPLPGRKRYLHAVPAVEARAELGHRLAGRYDVAALCEVFDPSEQRAIMAGWYSATRGAAGSHRPRTATGPPERRRRVPLVKSSGLFTLVDGIVSPAPPPTSTASAATGSSTPTPGRHKGALLVEVDVGAGANLEVYSTHLIWGGDLVLRHGATPLGSGRRSARPSPTSCSTSSAAPTPRATSRCWWATSTSGALHPSPAYADLTAAMNDAGFDDVWLEHGTGVGHTCDASALRDAIAVPDPDATDLCRDDLEPPPEAAAGKRIDFAWLRRPSAGDRVQVEVRTVRRACFPRESGVDGYDDLPYLSDHLGLHLELTLT